MFKAYEYSRDRRGNFVTDSKGAPYKWFRVSEPRSTKLKEKNVALCLDTFVGRKRKYITGLIKLKYKSCYVGDIQDSTIVIWYKGNKLELLILDNTKGQKLNERKKASHRLLESFIKNDKSD